jgi:5-methylcytosine-specific restriction endonuclease McrA
MFSHNTLNKYDGFCARCFKHKYKYKNINKPKQKWIRKSIPKIVKCQAWDYHIGKNNGVGNCFTCNKNIDSKHFECGHIIARKNGGEDVLENLMPICELCNKSMGTMNMMEFKEIYFNSNKNINDNSNNSNINNKNPKKVDIINFIENLCNKKDKYSKISDFIYKNKNIDICNLNSKQIDKKYKRAQKFKKISLKKGYNNFIFDLNNIIKKFYN